MDDYEFVPLTNKSLEPDADGDYLPDIAELDRVGNLVRYMRRHPAYTAPRPWPKSMAIIGLKDQSDKGMAVVAGTAVAMDTFESKTDKFVMDAFPDEVDMVVFLPVAQEHDEETINQILNNDNIAHTLQYLINNRWFLKRDEVT